MTFAQRLLVLAILPVLALLSVQAWYPSALESFGDALLPYGLEIPIFRGFLHDQPLLRSETPIVITAFPHFSHWEKIAKIAVALAEVGYPITFITGRIFEEETKQLHSNIVFQPIHGKADKLTEEDYKKWMSFEPGISEQRLFVEAHALVDGMPDQHSTLQQVFRELREAHGDSKPLLSLFDLAVLGHLPLFLAFWDKAQGMGAVEMYDWHIYHTMEALPDHLMSLGVTKFEFPRKDLRSNVRYLGALPTIGSAQSSKRDLPDWWDDIEAAKADGKKIVAVSQGTVAMEFGDLLLSTLRALEDLDHVLFIATTVAVEVEDVPNLVVPRNARVAKFVPYDLLLPKLDVLVNNGSYGAVITSLNAGVPMVLAGTGQDKNVTNSIVEWRELGINLEKQNPIVAEIREAVTEVLQNEKNKRNAMTMSKNFERYNAGQVVDGVIQDVVRRWQKEKRSRRI
ncbi:UDP-Glycosyltransferase/glycogen phosphorylase [Setomelanomma holmii]|uniref:UDP-Glycosyltransferase/glycogen phosphorylase n=1 Tax=Setomelanomma holmii TaxID=210430 RepID=A0A9P4GW58_9PLEO|nr:UDP-Glycosyltransferase/glycogen phosphorylase [Setomelanomma holmii]